jgi:uncharacterized protein YkwD
VLPALTAVLVGAVTAGAATLISHVATSDGPDSSQVALSAADAEDSQGGFSRPDNRMGSGSDGKSGKADGDTDGTSAEPPSAGGGDNGDSPTSSGGGSENTESETTATGSSKPELDAVEDEVVELVNAERADAGCNPLNVDAKLAQAAQDHSADMAERDYFDHTTPEGLTFAERIVNAGYPTPGAENIAVGQQNAEQVMEGWMNSDGHRANILNCELTNIGVGFVENGMYWTQDFGY